MKMNGVEIAEVSEKGTVGKSVEVFGDCCFQNFFFLFSMGFRVFLKCFQEKIFCVSGSKIPFSDIFFSARVKIAVSVSTDLEDDVIFFIKDF